MRRRSRRTASAPTTRRSWSKRIETSSAGVRESHADRNGGLSRLLLDLGTRVVVAHGVVGER
jgi:hypothetical protein